MLLYFSEIIFTSYIMKLSDFQIVYINLEKRPERKKYIETQLAKMGLLKQALYIPAIDGQSLPKNIQDYYLKRFKTMAKKRERILGRIGCYLTHKMILHAAIMSGVEKLLVIEDDCKFLQYKNLKIPEPPSDAEIFYLGGLFWKQKPEPKQQIQNNLTLSWIPIDRYHLKIATTFCYGIIGKHHIKSVYDKINNAKKPSAIDLLYINCVQNQPGSCYILNPVLSIQEHKFPSDITFKGTKNPEKPYKNSYFYQKSQESAL